MTMKKLQNGEKSPASNHEELDAELAKLYDTTEHQKISRKEHEGYKRRAVAFERTNNQYILLIPCSGNKGWYEMGDRSALFYKYAVCHKLGIETLIKNDYDAYGAQFETGRIRVKDVSSIRRTLEKAGLFAGDVAKDQCVICALSCKFSEEEIQDMQARELRYQAQLNEIVKVKLLDPVVMATMIRLSSRLHRACLVKMDKVSRDTNGRRIVSKCDRVLFVYYEMSDKANPTTEEELEIWDNLRKCVHELLIELQIVVDVGIWSRKKMISIAGEVHDVEERIDSHIYHTKEKLEKEKKKNAADRSKSSRS